MRLRLLTAIAALLAVGGCDAWPTVVNNRTEHPIRLRYLAEGYSYWSATIPIAAGKAQRLAREHWVQDIRGISIEEQGRVYTLSYQRMAPIRGWCSSIWILRRLKFVPDCYMDYLGEGRLRSSFTEPERLTFQTPEELSLSNSR